MPPKRRQPPPSWSGHLLRTKDGIAGRLACADGWALLLTALWQGNIQPPRLHLRADVATVGPAGTGLRDELHDLPVLLGDLLRDGDGWEGEISRHGHVLALTGTSPSPGRIDLVGAG